MSRLKVFCGEETARRNSVSLADDPPIFNYESYADRWRKYRNDPLDARGSLRRFGNDPLDRARSLRCNDRCPHCSRSLVKPLELDDAVRSRNNLPIPGTATLVGFHCEGCHWEWPA
jgi:hypothetical protein